MKRHLHATRNRERRAESGLTRLAWLCSSRGFLRITKSINTCVVGEHEPDSRVLTAVRYMLLGFFSVAVSFVPEPVLRSSGDAVLLCSVGPV